MPVQPAGRAVASVLMIVGFVSPSLLTGVIASALIARHTSTREEFQALHAGVSASSGGSTASQQALGSRQPG